MGGYFSRDANAHPIGSPYSIGSILESRHENIFQGKPSVTLTATLENRSGKKAIYKGAFVKRGCEVDRNVCRQLYTGEVGVIFAARTKKGFFQSLRGTKGICLWEIEGSSYCVAFAWNIPKYKKVFFSKNANIVAFGLLLDLGRFSKEGSINEALFDELMKCSVKMKPGEFQNHGNFQRFAANDRKKWDHKVNQRAPFTTSAIIVNDQFRLIAEVTPDREAIVSLQLTRTSASISKPIKARVKLVAFRRCLCEYDNHHYFRYNVFNGQFCDNGRGYVLAYYFQYEGQDKGLFISCTAEHDMALNTMVFGGFADPDWSLQDCLQHRRTCLERHSDLGFTIFELGYLRKLPSDNLIYSAKNQTQCNDTVFRPGGQLWARDWIRDFSRLLGLHTIFPGLSEMIEADPRLLVNYDPEEQAAASSDTILHDHLRKCYVPNE